MPEENIKILDIVRKIVYKKQEEILAMSEQDPKQVKIANDAVRFINVPQYMRKIDMHAAFLLFRYCGFPENEWEDLYYKGVMETEQSNTYTYVNPEDIERLAR